MGGGRFGGDTVWCLKVCGPGRVGKNVPPLSYANVGFPPTEQRENMDTTPCAELTHHYHDAQSYSGPTFFQGNQLGIITTYTPILHQAKHAMPNHLHAAL